MCGLLCLAIMSHPMLLQRSRVCDHLQAAQHIGFIKEQKASHLQVNLLELQTVHVSALSMQHTPLSDIYILHRKQLGHARYGKATVKHEGN